MEFVGVVPTEIIAKLAKSIPLRKFIPGFNKHYLTEGGFSYNPSKTAKLISTLTTKLQFLPRKIMEKDDNWQQIIPYVLITREKSVFTTLRLAKSTEQRLKDKLSIGIGGHINPQDTEKHSNSIWGCMLRELREEVYLNPNKIKPIPIGVVNHSRDSVGKVHFGIVFQIDLSDATIKVSVKEKHKLFGKFQNWNDLNKSQLELWTQMIWEKRFQFIKRKGV